MYKCINSLEFLLQYLKSIWKKHEERKRKEENHWFTLCLVVHLAPWRYMLYNLVVIWIGILCLSCSFIFFTKKWSVEFWEEREVKVWFCVRYLFQTAITRMLNTFISFLNAEIMVLYLKNSSTLCLLESWMCFDFFLH